MTVTAPIKFYKKHQKIYPRHVKGVFRHWGNATAFITQLVFYGLPWLSWNGRQAVLLNLEERRFYLFGTVLWPQDVLVLALFLVFCAYSLFLITNVAGRVWCGYACPQTVYSKIFIAIEQWVEGNRSSQLALDKMPWNWRKFRLRGTRHLLWVVLALYTGFTFVGYFVPIRDLGLRFLDFNLGGGEVFWFGFYSFATWGNAGFMREQVCLSMCPYARFQSTIFDSDTFIVAYDKERGEPRKAEARLRGVLSYGELRSHDLGDCIDCSLCVQVCPTGIDIRNGLQYECIGCGACIDACDGVMEKLGYPKGLVRYTSERALAAGKSLKQMAGRLLRPSVVLYSTIWLVMLVLLLVFFVIRKDIKVDVMHDRASIYHQEDDGSVSNLYQVQLINTREVPVALSFTVEGKGDLVVEGSGKLTLAPLDNHIVSLALKWQPAASGEDDDHEGDDDDRKGGKHDDDDGRTERRASHSEEVWLLVSDDKGVLAREKVRFFSPF